MERGDVRGTKSEEEERETGERGDGNERKYEEGRVHKAMRPFAYTSPVVFVTTSAQSSARDAAAIAAGTPSYALMQRAGAAAAAAIKRHAAQRLVGGVVVFAGAGNNGGDAWIVAGALRRDGVTVRVHATADPATDDARAARTDALAAGPFDAPRGDETIVVDGLLGTGSSGAPRGAVAAALDQIRAARTRGAFVLALDVPSGLDATTGEVPAGVVPADVTVTFGTLKRGLVIAREVAGAIEVADIGLGAAAAAIADGAPPVLDAETVRAAIPPIAASAHKGTRGRIAIVGGSTGMAGATVYAARGALRSGAGLVRLVVAPESLESVQRTVPEATASIWPASAADVAAAIGNPDALVLGPGLGANGRDVLTRVLAGSRAKAVLDADALNAFAGDVNALRGALDGRDAMLTPHAAECARVLGVATADVLRERFEIGLRLARAAHAVVVLKGTPTVISAPDGRVVVAPVGSPVLATGGSGDVLAGIAGVLVATMPNAFAAAQAAVWAHGAAAEHVATTNVRGATLDDVMHALRDVWHAPVAVLPPGVLAVLPAVGER